MNLKQFTLCFTILLTACTDISSVTENGLPTVVNSSVSSEDGWFIYHDDRFGFSMRFPEVVYDHDKERKMIVKQYPWGINFGYETEYGFLGRSVEVSQVMNDQEILDLIHAAKRFGTDCSFKKLGGKNNNFAIEVVGNGNPLAGEGTCGANFAYSIKYQADTGKIAYIYLSQEPIFGKPPTDNSDSYPYYDDSSVFDFKFD